MAGEFVPQDSLTPIAKKLNLVNNNDVFHSVGLFSKDEINEARFSKFSRFGRLFNPYGKMRPGREYLFFVKPDLHICMPPGEVSVFAETLKENKQTFDTSNPSWFQELLTAASKYGGISEGVFQTNANGISDSGNFSSVYNLTKKLFKMDTSATYSRTIGKQRLALNPQLCNNNYFQYLLLHNPLVIGELQYSLNTKEPFSYLLSSSVANELSLDSSTLKTMDNSATMFGATYNYLQDSEASDQAMSFSLDFVDNKYMDTYNFFKAYNEYQISRKSGLVTPPHMNYYRYKRLHNTMGIYKFVVGDDHETLLYWAYLWGVIPLLSPRDAFNDSNFDDGLKFSINFEAAFIDDMKLSILEQFNNLMSNNLLQSVNQDNYMPIVKDINVNSGLNSNTVSSALKAAGFTSKEMSGTGTQINWELPIGALVLPSSSSSSYRAEYKLRWYAKS